MTGRSRRGGAVAAVAAAVLACAASAAEAGPLVADAASCEPAPLERPFLPFADPAFYELVPGGTFEPAAGGTRWRLDAARVVTGNEPFYVHAPGEWRSLRIPGGTRVTSPVMCVGVEHPTLRFVARNQGSAFEPLAVAVEFEDAAGRVQTVPIGALAGTSRWLPTAPLPVIANLLPLLPGQRTPVRFSFSTPTGGTGWQVDDVYVDPYSKN